MRYFGAMLSKDLDSAINAEVRRRQASFNAKLKPILEKAITSAVAWAISEALNGGHTPGLIDVTKAKPAANRQSRRKRAFYGRMTPEKKTRVIEMLKQQVHKSQISRDLSTSIKMVERIATAARKAGEPIPYRGKMPEAISVPST